MRKRPGSSMRNPLLAGNTFTDFFAGAHTTLQSRVKLTIANFQTTPLTSKAPKSRFKSRPISGNNRNNRQTTKEDPQSTLPQSFRASTNNVPSRPVSNFQMERNSVRRRESAQKNPNFGNQRRATADDSIPQQHLNNLVNNMMYNDDYTGLGQNDYRVQPKMSSMQNLTEVANINLPGNNNSKNNTFNNPSIIQTPITQPHQGNQSVGITMMSVDRDDQTEGASDMLMMNSVGVTPCNLASQTINNSQAQYAYGGMHPHNHSQQEFRDGNRQDEANNKIESVSSVQRVRPQTAKLRTIANSRPMVADLMIAKRPGSSREQHKTIQHRSTPHLAMSNPQSYSMIHKKDPRLKPALAKPNYTYQNFAMQGPLVTSSSSGNIIAGDAKQSKFETIKKIMYEKQKGNVKVAEIIQTLPTETSQNVISAAQILSFDDNNRVLQENRQNQDLYVVDDINHKYMAQIEYGSGLDRQRQLNSLRSLSSKVLPQYTLQQPTTSSKANYQPKNRPPASTLNYVLDCQYSRDQTTRYRQKRQSSGHDITTQKCNESKNNKQSQPDQKENQINICDEQEAQENNENDYGIANGQKQLAQGRRNRNKKDLATITSDPSDPSSLEFNYNLTYRRSQKTTPRLVVNDNNLLAYYSQQVEMLNQMKQNLRELHQGMKPQIRNKLINAIRKVEVQTEKIESTLFKEENQTV